MIIGESYWQLILINDSLFAALSFFSQIIFLILRIRLEFAIVNCVSSCIICCLLMIYENKSYMNCGNEMKWRNDHRSCGRNLCNCVKKPEKKFRTSTGLEPVTSRLPVRCSTNWAMKPLTLGAGQLWVICSREKNEC